MENQEPAGSAHEYRRASNRKLPPAKHKPMLLILIFEFLAGRLHHATILFMFLGLEHPAIASPDPGRLAEWYVQKLDFRINFTYDGNYFVRAADGTMLEI